jgi:hypothetical protein
VRDFDHILNWKLLAGSHEFPGPEGGTCINEAAVVAAGFCYRAIDRVEKLPKCFSMVLSSFAMAINDTILDHERHKLMPFVMRLAGARDRPPVELERSNFIFARWIDRVLPVALKAIHLPEQAEILSRRQSLESARRAAFQAAKAALQQAQASGVAGNPNLRNLCLVAAVMCERAATVRSLLRGNLVVCPGTISLFGTVLHMQEEVYEHLLSYLGVWDIAIEILDDAMSIGRQAEPIEVAEIERRFEEERSRAVVRQDLEPVA